MTGQAAAEQFLEDPKRPLDRTLRVGACPHSYDGSSYYRVWLPFTHLDQASRHAVGIARPEDGVIGPEHVADVDVLVLQRPCGKTGTILLERLLGQTKLVYEVDDDMLQVDPSGLPHLYDEKLKESVRRCMRLCQMVTTTNEHLAETLRPYNDHIVILPNFVKQSLLDLPRPRRDKLVVGWAGGTSHLVDMVTVQEPLRRILDDHAGTVEMHWMGFDFSPLVGRQCRWSPWQKDVGHYYRGIDFDIAIAPSADIPFNRSKTPIRALEMAALGVPVVAADRLPYSEFVVDGKTGFLVDGDDGWYSALCALIRDDGLRADMGAAAREQARAWTIEGNWQLWEAAYEKAAAL